MSLPNDDHLTTLLARSALRDRRAFRELYESSGSHLFGIVLRIVRQREAAEEVLQEAWLQIWNKAGEYRADQGRPFTWMAAIARYRSLDRLRRQSRQAAMPNQIEVEEEQMGSIDLQSALESGAERETLLRCMGELNEETRQAITLAYVNGYSHSELSDQLGHPLGTIKSWIRRGLLSLRECLTATRQ